MGAHGELGQQRHQDGLHHHHGDVLTHAGARARAERLEVTTRSLEGDGGARTVRDIGHVGAESRRRRSGLIQNPQNTVTSADSGNITRDPIVRQKYVT